jgi:hypothetical protein
MDKVGRNDPCPCGSGKKFKKCCESKVKHKKFHAEVLTNETKPMAMTSLFKRSVAVPAPEAPALEEPKNIIM